MVIYQKYMLVISRASKLIAPAYCRKVEHD